MTPQNSKTDFSNQKIFVGIDVHKKSWTVTIRLKNMELKTFVMNPCPEQLYRFLQKTYPNAEYYTVYEAGFSGYWIDRKLKELGIKNIIVNPADIPTTDKERKTKTDRIDSRKLSLHLASSTLERIYVPTENNEEIRALNRIRFQLVDQKRKIKSRLKNFLMFTGKDIPEGSGSRRWSKKFYERLETIEFINEAGKESLKIHISMIKQLEEKIKEVEDKLKQLAEKHGYSTIIENLITIPGISFVTAMSLYSEIMDIRRFESFDHLCSYVGLVPSIRASGDKEKVLGMQKRQNKYLKNLIIESAWVAVKKDPALTMSFLELTRRMPKSKAIIRIAKKLLRRIRYVWINEVEYQLVVVA